MTNCHIQFDDLYAFDIESIFRMCYDGISHSNPIICSHISCNIIFLYRNNNMFVCKEGYFVSYET